MEKALIAMSGGVDSSVAAYLTMTLGYTAVGCTMRLFENEAVDARQQTCCSLDDVTDAKTVCRRLGIEHYVFNFADEFQKKVVGRFAEAYFEGKTPNPCIDCNRFLKFGKLFERADLLGCEKVVTGHYARIEEENGRFYLKKGLDEGKDQSYVLYHLTPAQLSRVLFPLGDLSKSEVRRIAEEQGFLNAKKPDSQDICFVPDGDYARVVQKVLGKESAPGPFLSPDGRVLGEHKGIIHYTVGQRKGLGIASSAPLYVTDVRSDLNAVILSHGEGLFTRTFEAQDLNLNGGEDFSSPRRVKVKIRYRAPEQPATVERTGEDTLRVTFEEPQRAVTRGQSAVVYDGDTVLGGGEICKIIK